MIEKNMTDADKAQAEKEIGLKILAATHATLSKGHREGHEDQLAKAAHHLWQAYSMGMKEPAVVWPLKGLWASTGHRDLIINLLKDYIHSSGDPLERFLAGHYVVDTYALMRDDANAVAHHRHYLAELGSSLPAWRKLWSLEDKTMTDSWERSGQIHDWLARTEALDKAIHVDSDEIRVTVAGYLRTRSVMLRQLGRSADAVSSLERIVELYRGIETPDAFRLTAQAYAWSFCLLKDPGDLDRTIRRALELTGRMEIVRQAVSARSGDDATKLAKEYTSCAHAVYSALGCQLDSIGRSGDAVKLLEQSMVCLDNPGTRFLYAGALCAHSDRAAALENLRKAAGDPRSSWLVADIEEAFRKHPSFSSVREDPDFLAVVRGVASRYRSAGVVQPTGTTTKSEADRANQAPEDTARKLADPQR